MAELTTRPSLFFRVIASLAGLFGAKSLQTRCELKKAHIWRDVFKLMDYRKYGKNFLTPAINEHNLQTQDFYLQPLLPRAEIRDEHVREIMRPGEEQISFKHLKGICRGMGDWFFYLYFKTQQHLLDEETRLRAVAQEFENGAPCEAVLLQSLFSINLHTFSDLLLKLRVIPWIRLENEQLNSNIEHGVKVMLGQLPSGAYSICLPQHQINLCKVDDQRSYIFDPSKGLIRMDTLECCAQYIATLYQVLCQDVDSANSFPGSFFLSVRRIEPGGHSALSLEDSLQIPLSYQSRSSQLRALLSPQTATNEQPSEVSLLDPSRLPQLRRSRPELNSQVYSLLSQIRSQLSSQTAANGQSSGASRLDPSLVSQFISLSRLQTVANEQPSEASHVDPSPLPQLRTQLSSQTAASA